MKAILICTGSSGDMQRFGDNLPNCMFPLVDRPFVQHVVEFLIGAGVGEFELLVGQGREEVRNYLGDGARWGSTFRFHEVESATRPYASLDDAKLWDGDQAALVVHADRFPQFDLGEMVQRSHRTPCLIVNQDNASHGETGWALLTRDLAASAPEDAREEDFGDHLRLLRGALRVETADSQLSARSFADLLEAQRRVLTARSPGLFLNGREPRGEGVRICRNVRIHPSVEITAPVFLGDNVRIGKGSTLGPNTVVGDNCIVDRHTNLSNSMVMPETFVGEWLEVHDCVVDRERFVNTRLDTRVGVDDRLVLSTM